ncbi:MAG: homocysteine S-methyltransferase family protein [Calditrichia bacterium]
MRENMLQVMESGKILLADGAWGTMLHKRGLKAGACPELWNLEHPEIIEKIAADYIRAGACIIETNSFGGSRIRLNEFGAADKAAQLNELAARLSRKAAGEEAWVMGSIGPSGKMLLLAQVSEEALYKAFSEQAQALERGGADALCIETMMDLREAEVAIRSAVQNTRLPVFCTMTFQKGAAGKFHTMMGVSPEQMTATAKDAGAVAVGSNCGNGMAAMVEVARQIRSSDAAIPIIIQANAGVPENREGETVFPETAEEMARHIPALIEAGANIIGGCCGTDPAYIKKFAEVIEHYESASKTEE